MAVWVRVALGEKQVQNKRTTREGSRLVTSVSALMGDPLRDRVVGSILLEFSGVLLPRRTKTLSDDIV